MLIRAQIPRRCRAPRRGLAILRPVLPSRLQASLQLPVPLEAAYQHSISFERYPEFLPALREVRRLPRRRLLVLVEAGGSVHELTARIVEQRRNRHVRLQLEERVNGLAAVRFRSLPERTSEIHVSVDYELDPVRARLLDFLIEPQRHLEDGLERFRAAVESEAAHRRNGSGAL